ncbi:LexA family transcriptional regulator [Thermotoga maritima MSB8]|uniref:LexA repressor n=1 Tax=Thermotoga maritima (strain ATCC 43589 / DSM 3109 / JCM 10099 / NBRC 100826 / MSB8) TaxID=243274 RepID=LEXA_THEMA|nr:MULTISPECIES: transcriptional repressor LexA [Thermotoga]O33927.1 RecName: Full=LexA repressor [Thermotoga maritima MSB8]AAB87145.1 LexA [Thermotoga maritima MSB8]AAD36159.1 lexA repressor [Thermotoga maritima MSB8]AGL50010.1 SOS-response repressor and protease LexA [Thermotoga maritima MSB8]AHD19010.1 LexA family transcriptional regulator [Thermotoga maritima MSB8]AIY87239.1 lexA repressor [Thermotoga sp. 2812B]
MKDLTERQRKVLLFIEEFIEKNGYPPSVREIARRFRITPRGALLHLIALEKKGYIERKNGKPRALRISKSIRNKIPLIGEIRAGEKREAIEYLEDYIEIPESFLSSGYDHFLLKVKGESMIEEHICDGDLVLVRRQDWAQNGDIVAAMVDGEVTLKKFYQRGDTVELRPANREMSSMFFRAEKVKILGKVVGVFRKL